MDWMVEIMGVREGELCCSRQCLLFSQGSSGLYSRSVLLVFDFLRAVSRHQVRVPYTVWALRQFLKQSGLPLQTGFRIVVPVTQPLSHARYIRLVHRFAALTWFLRSYYPVSTVSYGGIIFLIPFPEVHFPKKGVTIRV